MSIENINPQHPDDQSEVVQFNSTSESNRPAMWPIRPVRYIINKALNGIKAAQPNLGPDDKSITDMLNEVELAERSDNVYFIDDYR